MIKKFFLSLSDNIRKYIIFSGIGTLLMALAIFIYSFSLAVTGVVVLSGVILTGCFGLFEFIRIKLSESKIRIVPIIISIVVLVSGGVAFMINYDFDKSLSYVFSKTDKISSSRELLEKNGDYKNISFTIDIDSFFKTSYKIEKVISEKDIMNESGAVSSVWDGDEWIDTVILERVVLYDYYVFPFDGKYFVAKVSPKAFQKNLEGHGKVTVECVASAPSGYEQKTCDAICSDVVSVLYGMDHFEGEENKDFFGDLTKVTGESSVLVTVEDRNMFSERVSVVIPVLMFLSGTLYILSLILYAPPMPDIKRTKKD